MMPIGYQKMLFPQLQDGPARTKRLQRGPYQGVQFVPGSVMNPTTATRKNPAALRLPATARARAIASLPHPSDATESEELWVTPSSRTSTSGRVIQLVTRCCTTHDRPSRFTVIETGARLSAMEELATTRASMATTRLALTFELGICNLSSTRLLRRRGADVEARSAAELPPNCRPESRRFHLN